MSRDVFISYKAEEFEEANFIRSFLETNGVSCWMAPLCIPGGSNYAMEIPKAIKEARVFVLLLSSRSQASKWVAREIDLAITEGKAILPFMIENCALREEFNFYLTNVQRYTAYENKSRELEKMLRDIRAVLGEAQPAMPTERPKKLPPPPKPSKKADRATVKSNILGILYLIGGVILATVNLWGRDDPGDFGDILMFVLPLNLLAIVLSVTDLIKLISKKRKELLRAMIFAVIGILLFVFCFVNEIMLFIELF